MPSNSTLLHKTGPLLRGTRGATIPANLLLDELRGASLILAEDWDKLTPSIQADLGTCSDSSLLLSQLVDYRLLTTYQKDRIRAGTFYGLLLGNYRVLDRLGSGGMGVIFLAEHIYMRRLVAIKVLSLSIEQDPRLLQRFYTEIRTIAQLQHPNIVAAYDAGQTDSGDLDAGILHYFVMEYVAGIDLEERIRRHGPFPVIEACDLIHQIAGALEEAQRRNLVHRDVKPSNILLTNEGHAKLLDFGLTRHMDHRMTDPGTVLGTLDYMAPEQVNDASQVDIRADIYGLGGTLYWCLTGESPFPGDGNPGHVLMRRLQQPPPSLANLRPDLPRELDGVIARMMATNAEDRFPTPKVVQQALLPFLKFDEEAERDERQGADPQPRGFSRHSAVAKNQQPPEGRVHRVLIVDDEPNLREFCKLILESDRLSCDEAADGRKALELLESKTYDLLVLDVAMPGITGLEVCRRLREKPPCPHLKIVLCSGHMSGDDMAQWLLAGADDCLTKPFSLIQLRSRVQAALRLKDAQDLSDSLNNHLVRINYELEQSLGVRDSQIISGRNALVFSLAQLVESREQEGADHLRRIQRYCRALAETAATLPVFAGRIDAPFIQLLECCAPLHDIGKVSLPDHILLKPGKLDGEERLLMQAHTTIGAEALQRVAERHGSALAFLQMAVDIAHHHHERYDGQGYPDRLAGDAIPLAARLVTVGDVYDGLRSRKSYKPALSHAAAVQVMTQASPGQFDPHLLQAFQTCAPEFNAIFQEFSSGG